MYHSELPVPLHFNPALRFSFHIIDDYARKLLLHYTYKALTEI